MDPSPASLIACEREGNKLPLLHSIRKPPAKPWKRASAPPTRVYVVHPSGFPELVQRLTGDARFASKRLQQFAPPSLNLLGPTPPPPHPKHKSSSPQLQLHLPGEPMKRTVHSFDFFGLSSPSSCCSFPFLSPGTIALLDQDTVL